jgi:MoxR-like ATPase
MMTEWSLFKGEGGPNPPEKFPEAPPWRRFGGGAAAAPAPPAIPATDAYWERARTFKTPQPAKDVVNAALHLRRPVLVTGNPGTGKSTLIYRVAYELGLGPVLVWPINSRTTLQDGLYRYDALDRLREARMPRHDGEDGEARARDLDIGRFIQLGPLGTALLASARPRALLIDEMDKADVDLPNDLLNVFEEGRFEIPELSRRQATEAASTVRLFSPVPVEEAASTATITGGWVECREFPFIVLTSNRERDFPPAFLRRCLRVEMPKPEPADLREIVREHLGEAIAARAGDLIDEFVRRQGTGAVATDQLLNAAHLLLGREGLPDQTVTALRALLLREIGLGA